MGSRLRALLPDPAALPLTNPTLKMDSKLVFPLTLLLLATIIDSGSGLNCYQCNSYEDALCADPFYHEGDGVNPGPAKSGDDFLKPCPHELHLCDCRPLHHGAWLPDTLDHPHLPKRRADNTPVGRTETEFSKHTKTFPRKKML